MVTINLLNLISLNLVSYTWAHVHDWPHPQLKTTYSGTPIDAPHDKAEKLLCLLLLVWTHLSGKSHIVQGWMLLQQSILDEPAGGWFMFFMFTIFVLWFPIHISSNPLETQPLHPICTRFNSLKIILIAKLTWPTFCWDMCFELKEVTLGLTPDENTNLLWTMPLNALPHLIMTIVNNLCDYLEVNSEETTRYQKVPICRERVSQWLLRHHTASLSMAWNT